MVWIKVVDRRGSNLSLSTQHTPGTDALNNWAWTSLKARTNYLLIWPSERLIQLRHKIPYSNPRRNLGQKEPYPVYR